MEPSYVMPNAGHQARREAEAQRKLYAVACMPLLGGVPLRTTTLPHLPP